MTPGEHYRSLADKFRAMARSESTAALQAEWESLALAYLRLAEQADKNESPDHTYEPALRPSFGDEPA